MGFKTKHLQREAVNMADNVSFKVYLKDPSQGEELEVRRFVVDKEVSTSLVYIKEKLVSIFPVLADKIFSVSWTDEDGDSITIDTDEELILALTELPGPVYKLTATVRAAKKVEEPQEPGVGANMTHHGVTCDGCDKAPIVGFRYKCVVCDDYDLCAACEKAGKHPGHNMMRISSPEVIWPQRLFKRIHKMQGWMGEQPGQPGGATPGAAGDHQDAQAQAQASASNAHASAHSAAQAAAQDAHSAAHAAAQAAQAAEEAFAAAGMPEGSGEEYLQRVGDFVAAALDPLGIDVQVDVETPGGQRTTVKPSAKTDKTEEEDQDKAASPEAAKEGSASSSDDEEWTVLSDKKPESEAVEIPIQVLDKEVAPVYPTLPAEESTTSTSTPRNTTTSANETQDQGAAAPASAPPATAVHPDPRIQVALQAMMNMGFSNDGGWLANLLEAKDGDIGKVLDILQPVKK